MLSSAKNAVKEFFLVGITIEINKNEQYTLFIGI